MSKFCVVAPICAIFQLVHLYIMQCQVKFLLCLKYSVIMMSGPGAKFLVKKPLVPTE